jgi:hypothetical protein
MSNEEYTPPQRALISQFLSRTGYGESEILALNFNTRSFYTRNGGRYRVEDSGSVTWISGPPVDPEDRL